MKTESKTVFNIKNFELFDEIRLFKIEEDTETHEQDTPDVNNSSK